MKQLIIAGFHRSGTSATALYLNACGLFIGHDLVRASASNPLGHGEDQEIRGFHDRLLSYNNLSWIVAEPFIPRLTPELWKELRTLAQARLMRSNAWGFKDPRVCLFLPLWRHVLPDSKLLVVYRDPRECAYSLARRHASELLAGIGNRAAHLRFFTEPDLALRMWLLHNRRLFEFASAHPRDTVVVGFRSLLGGFPLVHHLNERWGFDLAPVNPGTVIRADLLSEAPQNIRIGSEALIEPILEVWSKLRELEAKDLGQWAFECGYEEQDVSKNNFVVDEDLHNLRMENELLAFEVAFLKNSIEGLLRRRDARAQTQLAKVMNKLEASPVRLLFRRKRWYRKALAARTKTRS
jgi:hypothetical protein